jgi:uncharacterized protein
MTFLLDVNALLALGVHQHVFHERVTTWLTAFGPAHVPRIATCSITELGFVRVLSQARQYGLSVKEARELLLALKAAQSLQHMFVADDHNISRLPKWVKSPSQTTGGHLVELARSHGAHLATLDEHVEGAYLIP